MEIKTWWERLNCTRNPGAHSGEDVVRDEEIAELRAAIERQAQEVLKLHRDLAAEKLRADQGWHRYEAANSRKNELEAERANWAQEIMALKSRPFTQSHVYDWLTLVEKKIGTPTASAAAHVLKDFYEGAEIDQSQPSIQMREQDAKQLARSKWTVKQWYEHVGAWENAQGEVCFGSVMALGAMLKLMARARNSVAPITMPNDGLVPLSVDGEYVWLEGIGAVALDYSSVKSLSDIQDDATPMANQDATDAARLDWLNQNFFSDQKDEWDEFQSPDSIKWKFFGPMGMQGNVRDVIDAARTKDQPQ